MNTRKNEVSKNLTLFEKIINKEIPSVFLYEDEICVVIMDKFPSTEGQTLVIPRKPIDYIFDLDDETYKHIFKVAKKIALASDVALNTIRTCLVVEGFEVPHVHIRLYPVKYGEPLDIKSGEIKENDELSLIANKIKEKLSQF